MIVLGIETSCDETSAAVVKDGREILSNIVSSQIIIHRPFGGVVPELASRNHIENITGIVTEALNQAQIAQSEIDLIAVTRGPGLVGSLLVGIMFAAGLAQGLSCPVLGINHLEGHVFASIMENPRLPFPFISLLVSGGHTIIVKIENIGSYRVLGQTIDDAAGEAFDKVAHILGLGYPGGPAIDSISQIVDTKNIIPFPRPLFHKETLDFSFSGLKTAVMYHRKNISRDISEKEQAIIAASFQEAVIESLTKKTFSALEQHNISHCAIGGGVAANSALRRKLLEQGKKMNVHIYLPSKKFCTDNAAMIASCAFFRWEQGLERTPSIEVDPKLKL